MSLDARSTSSPRRTAKSLVILPSIGAVPHADGQITITRKFLDGVAEMARHWDGPVEVILPPIDATTDNLDSVRIDPREIGVAVKVVPFEAQRLLPELAEAGIVLATVYYLLNDAAEWCRQVGVPCVYVSEYTLQDAPADSRRRGLEPARPRPAEVLGIRTGAKNSGGPAPGGRRAMQRHADLRRVSADLREFVIVLRWPCRAPHADLARRIGSAVGLSQERSPASAGVFRPLNPHEGGRPSAARRPRTQTTPSAVRDDHLRRRGAGRRRCGNRSVRWA